MPRPLSLSLRPHSHTPIPLTHTQTRPELSLTVHGVAGGAVLAETVLAAAGAELARGARLAAAESLPAGSAAAVAVLVAAAGVVGAAALQPAAAAVPAGRAVSAAVVSRVTCREVRHHHNWALRDTNRRCRPTLALCHYHELHRVDSFESGHRLVRSCQCPT